MKITKNHALKRTLSLLLVLVLLLGMLPSLALAGASDLPFKVSLTDGTALTLTEDGTSAHTDMTGSLTLTNYKLTVPAGTEKVHFDFGANTGYMVRSSTCTAWPAALTASGDAAIPDNGFFCIWSGMSGYAHITVVKESAPAAELPITVSAGGSKLAMASGASETCALDWFGSGTATRYTATVPADTAAVSIAGSGSAVVRCQKNDTAQSVDAASAPVLSEGYYCLEMQNGSYCHLYFAKAAEPVPVTPTLSSIQVTTPPAKTVYTAGESFDPTGMVVTAAYSDGSSKSIANAELTITPAQLTAGTASVVIAYGGKEAAQAVTVNAAAPAASAEIPTGDAPDQRDESIDGVVSAITVSGAAVESSKWSHDGYTHILNVELAASTPADAALSVAFTLSRSDKYAPSLSCENPQAVTLSSGKADLTVTSSPWNAYVGLPTRTYTIHFRLKGSAVNQAPVLKDGSALAAVSPVNQAYAVDLSAVFMDNDGDALSYTVSIDHAEAAAAQKAFTYTPTAAGVHTLVFTANDGHADSPAFTLTLTAVAATDIQTNDSAKGRAFDSWISKITVQGAAVSSYRWVDSENTHKLFVVLDGATAKDAQLSLIFAGGSNMGGSLNLNCANPASVNLADGTASITVVNTPGFRNPARTYEILLTTTPNHEPARRAGVPAAVSAAKTTGEAYAVDLSAIFADADGDKLTYQVKIGDADAAAASEAYTYTPASAGTYTLVFSAADSWGPSAETYTVTLTVSDSAVTYAAAVLVPESVTPEFYATAGFGSDGCDQTGAALTAVKGQTADGFTAYTVAVPENLSRISVRGKVGALDWGGMCIKTAKGMDAVSLRQVLVRITTKINGAWLTASQVSARVQCGAQDGEGYATCGSAGSDDSGLFFRFLLKPSFGHNIDITPLGSLTAAYSATHNAVTVETGAGVQTVSCQLAGANQITFNIPKGAALSLGIKVRHYIPYNLQTPTQNKTNPDGTITCTYDLAEGQRYAYWINKAGKAKYSGSFVVSSGMNKTFTVTDADMASAGYISRQLGEIGDGTAADNQDVAGWVGLTTPNAVADIYLFINQQNYLQLSQGSTYQVHQCRNWMVCEDTCLKTYTVTMEPNFHYQVLDENGAASDSVVTIDENGLMTAVGEGTAIVLVTYDALTEKQACGTYSAIWPENTGVFVVSVGGDHSVATGMDIDSECWPLYYVKGTDGAKYTFTPESGSTVTVLHPTLDGDAPMRCTEGFSGDPVTANSDGSVTVTLINGRNIVKVAKGGSTAYQVITARETEMTVTNNTSAGGGYHPGDQISVRFQTIYHPANKMASAYNSYAVLSYYDQDGVEHKGDRARMFDFAYWPECQTITFTIPEDFKGDSYALTGGNVYYYGFGIAAGQHRTYIDFAKGTTSWEGGAESVSGHLAKLPDIVLPVTDSTANGKPYIRSSAANPSSQTLKVGVNECDVKLADIFADPENDKLTYTVSTGSGAETSCGAVYHFTAAANGQYNLYFRASDGHTYSEKYRLILYVSGLTGSENTKPVITGAASTAAGIQMGSSYTLDLSSVFFDAEGDELTYYAQVENAARTRLSSAAYSFTPSQPGVYVITLNASDGQLTSNNYTVTLTVSAAAPGENHAPVLTGSAAAAQTVTLGEIYSLNLASVFSDPDGDALHYSARLDSEPAGSIGAIYRWQPSQAGVHTLVFTADDGKLTSPAYTVTLTAEAAAENHAPALTGSASVSRTITLGETYSLNLLNVFTDPDAGDTLRYTVKADGTSAPAAARYRLTPAETGTYTLVFTASDGTLSSAPFTVTLTVVKKSDALVFDITDAQADGHVWVGFEDRGVRTDLSVDMPYALGTILPAASVPFQTGDTIATVTLRLLKAAGITPVYTGTAASNFYLSAIRNFTVGGTTYPTLGDYDGGSSSGWMVSLNNWFINKMSSDFAVEDGDRIRWQYTCQLGHDIGENYNTKSAKITGITFQQNYGTLSPSFSTGVKAYTYTVPATVTSIALEAQQENYGARLTYTANGREYKPLQSIPVADGTRITLRCEFRAYATDAVPQDTDTILITIRYQTGAGADPENQKAADVVTALIDAIGTVTENSADRIRAARTAYQALTGPQKELVTNYAALIAAESAYARLTIGVPFIDVTGHWALDAIRYAYENKLFQGVSAVEFAPDACMTRAMLVTVLYRLDGSPETDAAGKFSDVPDRQYYTGAVNWAAANGIVNGMGHGKFAPDASVTREQLAAVMMRYAAFKGWDVSRSADLSGYRDFAGVRAYAVRAMQWAKAEGLIDGRTRDMLVPAGKATRAEVAAILMRLCKNIAR